MRFKNKTVIITGAGSGIGEKTAIKFAQEGANVVIADIDIAKAEIVEDKINEKIGSAFFVETNVANYESINEMVNKTIAKYGPPDILINNAGINVFGEPLNMPDSEWKRAFSVDLDGVWFGCKAVLPHMLKMNKGSIVNVASVHGIQIIPNCFPYPVAKHGVIGLTKALAVDYASKGIKINSISPGYIDTPIVERFFKTKPDPQAARKEAENHQPIKRMGTTDEIANTIMFMSSDECNFMIGANIVVDGGITLRMHENDDTGAG
ncbi:MAG: short-chain dehydrogenase [Crocinitomicaceae bacterium]|nr:short-chain dehydrogenase [Crocinitomicaceae bacterium]